MATNVRQMLTDAVMESFIDAIAHSKVKCMFVGPDNTDAMMRECGPGSVELPRPLLVDDRTASRLSKDIAAFVGHLEAAGITSVIVKHGYPRASVVDGLVSLAGWEIWFRPLGAGAI